jgi:heme-degrading monooxygenase HmoA
MPFVAVTRVRVRARRFLPILVLQLMRSGVHERRAEGNLSVELLREAGRTFWVRSVWSTDSSMQDFIESKARRVVMRRLARWCDEASATQWPQLSSAAPSWPEAHRRMQESGRPYRVDHPSDDHLRFRIPQPDLARGRSMRFR